MPRNINETRLSGRMLKDPDLLLDKNKIPVLLFTLVNEYTIGYGETQRVIKSHLDCFARAGVAKHIAEHYKKDDEIMVFGRVQERAYTGETGPRTGTEIFVNYTRGLRDEK